MLFSSIPRNPIENVKVRTMIEKNRAGYLYKQSGDNNNIGPTYPLTTSLATFLRIVDAISDEVLLLSKPLGAMSSAVHILFGKHRTAGNLISTFWERSCALSAVARVNDRRKHGFIRASTIIFGILGKQFGDQLQIAPPGPVNVQTAVRGDAKTMEWKANTLIVFPDHHPGSDFMLCVRDENENENKNEIYMLHEVNVGLPPNSSVPQILGAKLVLALADQVERCNLSSLPVEQQVAALEKVLYVLSIYGTEWKRDKKAVKAVKACLASEGRAARTKKLELEKEILEENLREGREMATDRAKTLAKPAMVQLAESFVKVHWDSIAFLGTQEMCSSMVPVVLPIAQLMQALPDKEN